MIDQVADNRWIATVLSDLEKIVANQGEQIAALETKLINCLSQPITSPTETSAEAPGQSPLYRTLYSLGEMINRHTQIIQNISERVEL